MVCAAPHVPSDSTPALPLIIQHDKETPFRIGFYGDFTQRPMIRVELTRTILRQSFHEWADAARKSPCAD